MRNRSLVRLIRARTNSRNGTPRNGAAVAGGNESVDQRRSRKEVELIFLALNCSCTNLDEEGTRRQIRGALDAGATRDEIVLVLKCGVGLAVHSCSLGAPILLEEMKAAGVKPAGGPKPETPACDAMRAIGQWNTAWDPFYELSPLWTDEFFAFGASIYKSGIFTPRFMELISIAFDASITHMYAPGMRRHIQGALKAGATPKRSWRSCRFAFRWAFKLVPRACRSLPKN